MKRKTWLLVANATIAKVYDNPKVGELHLIETLEHPEGRLAAQELESDARGQEFSRIGKSANTYEPAVGPEKQQMAIFAREIGEFLEHRRQENSFERLFIAAAPGILGMLRQAISQPLSETVVAEESKDLTSQNPDQLLKNLTFAL